MRRNGTRADIDYETFVFDGCLEKVISHSAFEANKVPKLELAWTVKFAARDSNKFLKFIKDKITGRDPVDFQYLKRIQKVKPVTTCPGEVILWAIASSVTFVAEENTLKSMMNEYAIDVKEFQMVEVPNNYPYDKETSDKWGESLWPTIWKGNPVIQELNEVKISTATERKFLEEIAQISRRLQAEGVSQIQFDSSLVSLLTYHA